MNDSGHTSSPDRVLLHGDGYTAEAGWFGADDRPRFGWLYRPEAPTHTTGIVIVPPFGFEAVCAHRSLRRLAEDAAKAGLLALRFDLDGAGNSTGDDNDPDRVEAWLASIHDACDLVRSAGAGQLALVGARLGATLAALTASRRQDVAALVAINAVVRGRDFLREARALQATMGLRPPPSPQADDGSQESNGFVIGAETRAQLGAIDLAKQASPGVRTALLIERDDMPERGAWPERLRADGIETVVQRLPGIREMFDVPHLAVVPQAMIDACITGVRQAPTLPGPAATPRSTVSLRPVTRILVGATTIVEQAVLIDDCMFGILSRSDATTQHRGIALFNAGAVKHIGPNRMYVSWARQWAARGEWVLRIDLSGIGDSVVRAGAQDNHVYSQHGIADAARIAAWLKQRGATHVIACGNCSGAYHALRAALVDNAIDTLVLINPGAMQDIGFIDNITTERIGDSYYTNQIKSGRGLRKLLSGKIPLRRLIHIAGWYVTTYSRSSWRELCRRLRLPLRNDLGTELSALAGRGVKTHFVFSADDSSRAQLGVLAGSTAKRLIRQGHVEVQVIDGPDHTFTQRWAQQRLEEILGAILDSMDQGRR